MAHIEAFAIGKRRFDPTAALAHEERQARFGHRVEPFEFLVEPADFWPCDHARQGQLFFQWHRALARGCQNRHICFARQRLDPAIGPFGLAQIIAVQGRGNHQYFETSLSCVLRFHVMHPLIKNYEIKTMGFLYRAHVIRELFGKQENQSRKFARFRWGCRVMLDWAFRSIYHKRAVYIWLTELHKFRLTEI